MRAVTSAGVLLNVAFMSFVLLWSCAFTAQLTAQLTKRGFKASFSTLAELIRMQQDRRAGPACVDAGTRMSASERSIGWRCGCLGAAAEAWPPRGGAGAN